MEVIEETGRKESVVRIAVLTTCFNRRLVTIPNLEKLRRALRMVSDLEAHFYVVDDASPDGTYEAVKASLPDAVVIRTAGDCFWTGGMTFAHKAARSSQSGYEAYLLFNDDVAVDEFAVKEFFDAYIGTKRGKCPALVGATHEPENPSLISYSGFNRASKWRPRSVSRVIPEPDKLVPLEMPNANFLLVDSRIFDEIGGLDYGYVHGHADIDLGLRLAKSGREVLLFGRPIGQCARNQPLNLMLQKLSYRERFKLIHGPKYSNHDFFRFCRKHYPLLLYPLVVTVGVLRKTKMIFFP